MRKHLGILTRIHKLAHLAILCPQIPRSEEYFLTKDEHLSFFVCYPLDTSVTIENCFTVFCSMARSLKYPKYHAKD